MAKKVIYSPKAPRATSPHSHAVKTGNLVFVSDCLAYYDDLKIAKGDLSAQTRQCMPNVKHLLESAGTTLDKVVKVNVFLDRRADLEEMSAIYREFFGDYPDEWRARATVEARLPRKDFLREIECVAEVRFSATYMVAPTHEERIRHERSGTRPPG